MRHFLVAFAVALSLAILAHCAAAQPARSEPSNHAVLLPPQSLDDTAKSPNTNRERNGEWSIWGGVFLMQPAFGTNGAFLVNSGGGAVTRQSDFSQSLNFAPVAGLSYLSERGWGARGRWFQFDHGSSADYAAAPGESITGISSFTAGRMPIVGAVAARSELAVHVAEVEGTCNIEGPRWSHLLGIGVRYARMSQDYRATLASPATRIDLISGHNFNGVGPTFSVETRRRIGEKGFTVYGDLHGAILFGRAKELQHAVNNGAAFEFTRQETRVLPVGELEVGAEYARNIGRARVFVQSGFVGQVWFNGGNASNLDAVGFTSAANSNFGFLGLALRAGVRY